MVGLGGGSEGQPRDGEEEDDGGGEEEVEVVAAAAMHLVGGEIWAGRGRGGEGLVSRLVSVSPPEHELPPHTGTFGVFAGRCLWNVVFHAA